MKIFLTGATGFIGSHVARLLLREGYQIHALIRNGSSTRRIQDILSSLQVIPGDITKPDEWKPEIKKLKPEMAFHLAWYAVPGEYLTSFENIPLIQSSLLLAQALAEAGCKKLLAAGSCFEYDADFGYLSESTPMRPRTLYAASKLALQIVLEQFSLLSGMAFAWLRFFYLYGPFEDERRLVPMTIRSLLQGDEMKTTSQEQIRDFLHIEDVAEAVWAVATSKLEGAVNIGSGKPVSVTDVVTRIGRILNRPDLLRIGAIPPRSWDAPFVCANNRRLIENTSWKQKFDLEEGLRQTVEWWKKFK